MKVKLMVQHALLRLLQSLMARAGSSSCTGKPPCQSPAHTDSIGALQVDFGGQHTLLVVIDDSAPTSTAPAAATTTAGGVLLLCCKLSCIYCPAGGMTMLPQGISSAPGSAEAAPLENSQAVGMDIDAPAQAEEAPILQNGIITGTLLF